MKRLVIAVALLSLSGLTRAEDLLCEGHTWFNGQQADEHRVLQADFQRGVASITTRNGNAVGAIKVDGTSYMGILQSMNGPRYSFTLDRYSGEMFLIPLPPTGHIAPGESFQTEFTGTCSRAQPRF